MKKQTKTMLILLCLLLTAAMAPAASAHEVYFETPEEIVAGKPVDIKLYWGHFPAAPDPESAYFNTIPEGKLYVLTPEGGEIPLTLTVADDHYTTSFTPATGGDFQVIFNHNRGILDWQHGEPMGMQEIHSLAKIFVPVDGEPDIHAYDHPANLDLEVIPTTDIGHFHEGGEFGGVLLYQGQPLPNVKVTVGSSGSPDSHEDFKELVTDEKGEFKFTADKAGVWMVKVGYFDAGRAGEADGVAFDGVRYSLVTYFDAHSHENGAHTQGAQTPRGSGGITTWLLIGSVLLLAGALVFFLRGKKSA
ncbi:MAG: DUF4198 domain-containing protein [Bacillota bacterium]